MGRQAPTHGGADQRRDARGLPDGPQVLHFGKAQTETSITLTPGKHTLQLVLGDQYHVPFKPSVVSQKITVDVK